jgi:hypothetical protein
MKNNPISLTRVDTDVVIELINVAKNRMIFAKPFRESSVGYESNE